MYRYRLYIDRSDYLSSGNGQSIGQGLFAGLLIPAGTRIITYKGSILTNDEYNKKILTYGDIDQRGSYTLHLTLDTVLDCSKFANDGTCFASMANSPRNTFHYKTGKKANANSKIVTFASGAYLVATRSIPRYDEILTPYGVKYKMISSMK